MLYNRSPLLENYEADRDHAYKITSNYRLYMRESDSGLNTYMRDFSQTDSPIYIGYGFNLLGQSGEETAEMLDGLTADRRHFRAKEIELVNACRDQRPMRWPGHPFHNIVPDALDVFTRLGRVELKDEAAAADLQNRHAQKWEDSFDRAIQNRVFPYSRERAAIISAGMSLHDGSVEGWKNHFSDIISWITLDQQDAIAQRARPEIFSTLRYNLIPEKSATLAKQRLFESELFGLTDHENVKPAQLGITERVLQQRNNQAKKFFNTYGDKILKTSQNLFTRYIHNFNITPDMDKIKQETSGCKATRRVPRSRKMQRSY